MSKPQIDRQMDARVKELITNNSVFLEYPLSEKQSIRKNLPAPKNPNSDMSIWTILKENIGKDLSKISMPVAFNEPISMVQKHAEFLEYQEVLRQANKELDEYKRIGLVLSAFYMTFSNSIGRISKPFNSLLGETFELVTDDFELVAEQLSHHPPVTALYCQTSDFILTSTLYLKTKLSLTSFEIFDLGLTTIKLLRTEEVFEVRPPKANLHNYLLGNPYVWFSEKLTVINKLTGVSAYVKFKEKGWTSKGDYKISGGVFSADKKETIIFKGLWSVELTGKLKDGTSFEFVKRKNSPAGNDKQYMFTEFCMTLNHLSKELVTYLPPTDSRLRPDIRALDYGDIEQSSREKTRLEQKQRDLRHRLKSEKQEHLPAWFIFQLSDKDFDVKFKNTYFETRKTGKWPEDLLCLYNK